ncbi:MAG: ATP phosphoribosyltransferase regulatory subunit [Candidatus Pacearchaeota archaeon]
MEEVKGFRDFLGEEAKKREKIIEIIKEVFKKYGFEPAETPVIEYEEFVKGNNQDDEAVRDVFKLKDRGERNLALRYEFTFQLKRISKNQKLPFKRYQIGYVFRDEPIRRGRLRQFIQCDVDVVGSTIKDEAEVLCLTKECFDKLKIPVKIFVNNRKLLDEILEEQKIKKENREQVLRELDKIGKINEKEIEEKLKELKAENILNIFNKDENFFSKYKSFNEIEELKKYCSYFGFDVFFKPNLVRGLSYYNGSVFEIYSDELNVSLSGGGSYLVSGIQSTGISLGLEPIFLVAKINLDGESYLVISLGKDKEAAELSQKLRRKGLIVDFISGKSPTKALEYANSKKIKKVIFVGENEVKNKKFKVKNLETGKEEDLKI